MPSILFVCTANRFRSPLAAALFDKYLQDSGEEGYWQVSSAGTWAIPGEPVISLLEPVADELGLDLSGHRSSTLDERMLRYHDLILVMEPGQKEALLAEYPAQREHVYLLSQVVERKEYAIPDTFQTSRQVERVAALLQNLLSNGYRGICVLAVYLHNLREQSGE